MLTLAMIFNCYIFDMYLPEQLNIIKPHLKITKSTSIRLVLSIKLDNWVTTHLVLVHENMPFNCKNEYSDHFG